MLTIETWLAFAEGRFADASEHAQNAVALARRMGTSLDALPLAGRTALWARDVDRLQAALDLFGELRESFPVVEALRATFRAGHEALLDRRDEAAASYRVAARGWRDLRLPWELALCQLEAATFLGPDHPDAAAAAEEARPIFARLGAAPFLSRLEEASARRDAGESASRPAGRATGPHAAAGPGAGSPTTGLAVEPG